MADPGALQDIPDSLKIAYPVRAIRPMVNVETPFRKKLKRDIPSGARATEGGLLNFAANMNPPNNVAQIADSQTLPTPIDRLEKQWTLKPTLFVGDFMIGWATKKAAISQKSSFSAGGELRRRTEETITDVAKFIEMTYLAGTGTGSRAVTSIMGAAGNVVPLVFPQGGYFLRENYRVSIRTTDGGAVIGGGGTADYRTITALDTSSAVHTMTLSGAAIQTPAAGEYVHVVSELAQANLNAGVSAQGIRGIVSDVGYQVGGMFQNLSRVTYPKTRANVRYNPAGAGTLRDLTEQVLINAANENTQKSGKRITDAWINTGQAEKYIAFVAPDRTFPAQGGKLPGYVTGFDDDSLVHVYPGGRFNLHIGWDVMPRECYLLNMDTFFLYEAQELDWWDEGSMLKPVPVAGGYKAAFFAALASVENLGNDFPIGNTKIADLKDPRCGDV